jgi:hypothetical protein
MDNRIVAIGDTDTAKSSCLVEAYRSMCAGIQDRRTIRSNSIHIERNSELDRLQRCTNMTSENHEYKWFVCINDTRLFTMRWYDTVGGSIDPSSRWHADTVAKIRQADYVFAFFSCDELVKKNTADLRRTAKKVEMTLNTVMEGHAGKTKLVICLSKSDTVTAEQKQEIVSIFANVRGSVIGIPTMPYFVSTVEGHGFHSPMGPLLMAMDECLAKYQCGLSRLDVVNKVRASATDHALDAWKNHYSTGAWA